MASGSTLLPEAKSHAQGLREKHQIGSQLPIGNFKPEKAMREPGKVKGCSMKREE